MFMCLRDLPKMLLKPKPRDIPLDHFDTDDLDIHSYLYLPQFSSKFNRFTPSHQSCLPKSGLLSPKTNSSAKKKNLWCGIPPPLNLSLHPAPMPLLIPGPQISNQACELEWLLNTLQDTLASLKSGLQECVALLAPEEPGSTLALSSLRSECVKGFVTRVGARIVRGVSQCLEMHANARHSFLDFFQTLIFGRVFMFLGFFLYPKEKRIFDGSFTPALYSSLTEFFIFCFRTRLISPSGFHVHTPFYHKLRFSFNPPFNLFFPFANPFNPRQDIQLRLHTLPPPRSLPAYPLHIQTPLPPVPQLCALLTLLNQALDVIDISTWTGDPHNGSFITGQFRLLAEAIDEARQVLKGGEDAPGGKWWEDEGLAEGDESVCSSLIFLYQPINPCTNIVPEEPGTQPLITKTHHHLHNLR